MKFLIGLLIGLIAGAVASNYWVAATSEDDAYPIYTVASIKNHEPNPGNNSETTLMIFRKGNTGHVIEIVCLFPPDVVLNGGPNPSMAERLLGEPDPVWTGISTVRVLEKAETSGFGSDGYYCDRLS